MPNARPVLALSLSVLLACATSAPTEPDAPVAPAPDAPNPEATAADELAAPDTAAGRRLSSVIAFVSTWDGEPEKAEAFVDEVLAPVFRDQFPMEAHVDFLGTLKRDFPNLRLVRVYPEDEHALRAVLRSGESPRWLEMQLAVSAEAPHQIVAFGARPSGEPLPEETLALIDGELNRASVGAIVEVISKLLAEQYVDPSVAKQVAEKLNEAATSGRYDGAEDRRALAGLLTEDMQATASDRHLRVFAEEEKRPAEPAEGAEEEPKGPPVPPHGFVEAKVLEGNVGYVDLRFFAPREVAAPAADDAMKTVEGADAIIFDMRRNGGGDPRGVQYLCSFLFAERVHLNSLYWREGDRTEEYWTLDEVGGKKRPDVPVFVLTSGFTFSGAEEFTYNLQTRKRATIVGETTGGGANPGGVVPVGTRLSVFVPKGKAINPMTQTNWEGTGVKPDVEVKADEALEKAVKLARKAASRR